MPNFAEERDSEDQDVDETEMISEIGRINDIEGQRGFLYAALAVIWNIEINLRTTPSVSVNSCLCYIPRARQKASASPTKKRVVRFADDSRESRFFKDEHSEKNCCRAPSTRSLIPIIDGRCIFNRSENGGKMK
jgi:hypothetical protein